MRWRIENRSNILPKSPDDDEAMMLMVEEEKWLVHWLTGAVGRAAVAQRCDGVSVSR